MSLKKFSRQQKGKKFYTENKESKVCCNVTDLSKLEKSLLSCAFFFWLYGGVFNFSDIPVAEVNLYFHFSCSVIFIFSILSQIPNA